MKKVGDPASKRRRGMSTIGSSGTAAAPTQFPSLQAGSNSNDGTLANPITLEDSSDESNGDASISKIINNEIVSFYLLLFS